MLTASSETRHVSDGLHKSFALVNAVFLIDGSHSLKDACRRHSLDFRYERHGNRNSVERIFREAKRRTTSFQTVLATPKQTPPTSGFDLSPSHGIRLFDPYRCISLSV
jgi:transposase-like protein